MEEETENKNLVTISTALPKHVEAEIVMESVVAPDFDETEVKVLPKECHHVLPIRDL